MPQDIRELGRKVKAKYPGKYDDLADDDLGRKVKAKYPGAYDDFTDTPAVAPEAPGFFENVAIGAKRFGAKAAQSALAISEAVQGLERGDVRPALEAMGLAASGAVKTVAGFDPIGRAISGTVEAATQPVRQARAARQTTESPYAEGFQGARGVLNRADVRAAQDPSITGKITRGGTEAVLTALPAIATGAATGGSIPAMAVVGAAQQAYEPETMATGAALAASLIPVGQAFKAGVKAIRRTFGKGAAQIIEAESAPAIRPALPRETAPVGGEVAPVAAEAAPPAGNASPEYQRAMAQFEQEIQHINDLPRGDQASAIRAAVRNAARRASGDRSIESGVGPVSAETRAGYPPQLGAELEPPSFGVKAAAKPSYREATGPSVGANFDAYNAPGAAPSPGGLAADINAPWEPRWETQPLQQALIEGSRGLPTPIMQRIKDEFLGLLSLPKSLRSTLDISYPFRQGAILLMRPFQFRQSQKMLASMFRGFKTKNFEAINNAIAKHPERWAMDEGGLHITEPGGAPSRGEEAFFRPEGSKIAEFVTQKAGKYVGIKQSDQAFSVAGNVQRVERFLQFKRAIDKGGFSPEEAMKGYKAAAQWANITTGRGSLGQKLDRTMEGLNFVFFSPRFVASRLNILNPATYIKNMSSPAGRVVLKGQMADLAQYLGVVGTILYSAKQAGADVTLNPHDSDFGKIKIGTWRYDLGAGLSQALRASILIGEDIKKALMKEKPDHGKTAIDVGKTFLEYKLSPPAGVFRDLVARRTIDRKPFTYTGAVKDLIAPMQWADFVDAFQKEAFGGIAKTLPGVAGVGVQNYEQTPVDAAIERAQPLFTELKRLGKQVSELKKRGEGDKMEPDDIFNARVQQFGQNYTLYGLKLLQSERFRAASDEVKGKVLDALNSRAKSLTVRDMAFPELELDPDTLMDAVQSDEERKQERVRQRGF